MRNPFPYLESKMLTLILKRLGIGLITVLAVSLIIFFGTKILPEMLRKYDLGNLQHQKI